jgi:hypothetical protein
MGAVCLSWLATGFKENHPAAHAQAMPLALPGPGAHHCNAMRSFVLSQALPFPPAEVLDAMLHPSLDAFLLPRLADLQDRRELSRVTRGGVVERKTRCVPQPSKIPDVARGVVKHEMVAWVEEARFNLAQRVVAVDVVPNSFRDVFRFKGTIRVDPQGMGSVRRVEAQLEVKMFVVGRYAEDYLIEEIRRNMLAEGDALAAFMAAGLHRPA